VALLELVVDKGPLSIALLDRDLAIVGCNERMADAVGSTARASAGQPLSAMAPQLWLQIQAAVHRVLDGGEAVLDVEVVDDAGREGRRYWSVGCHPLLVAGEVVGVGVLMLEVTASRLAAATATFQAELLDTVGQAIMVLDPDRVITYWNHASAAMFGWSADEAIGRVSAELLPQESTPEDERALFDPLRPTRRFSAD
jgi:PAS domain-containing protein